MNDKLFIPKKIKIGFQERKDTYTGKLGYVIYYDNLGKLRKESSWESWRSNDIEPIEVDNDPVEGFVINRGAGGVRESWGWNARQEYVRVYDPREWEFEINIPNLLFILRECNCNKGKGLEGKFVYAWAGTQLVMLPVDTPEYRKSMAFTEIQGKKIAKADLVQGKTYLSIDAESITYIGRYKKHTHGYKDPGGLIHVFWGDGNYRFYETKNLKKIAVVSVEECHPELANMTTAYLLSKHGSPVVKYDLMKTVVEADRWGREYHWYAGEKGFHCYLFDNSPGCYLSRSVNTSQPKDYVYNSWNRDKSRMRSNHILVAVLESGSVYKVSNSWGGELDGEDIREEYSEFCRRSNTSDDRGSEEAACGDCTGGTASLEN